VDDLITVFDSVRDHIGKLMLLIGSVLLVAGALTLKNFGSVFSAGSLFFGILLVVFGLMAQLGLFSDNLRSWNGLGTIMMCFSIVFIAFSFAVIQFSEVNSADVVPIIFRGAVLGWKVVFSSERPYIWLSALFFQLGLVVLVVGIAIKIFNVALSRSGS